MKIFHFLDKYIERTNELILHCHVRGSPKPDIRWFKNDLEILPDRCERYRMTYDDEGICTLTISDPILHADRGRYDVKATNCAGEEACWLRVWFRGRDKTIEDDLAERAEYRRTQKMYKSRHAKPKDEDEWGGELYHSKRLDRQKEYDHRYKLSWLTRLYPQTISQGTTLKFVAFVDGKFPQYEWYFNDIPLVHGRKYRQIVTKNGKGCLIINNAQPNDSGLYKLIVKNYANSIDCEAKVVVYAYEHQNFEPPLFTNTLSGNNCETFNLKFYRKFKFSANVSILCVVSIIVSKLRLKIPQNTAQFHKFHTMCPASIHKLFIYRFIRSND
jgi:hypothetical protein